MDLVEGADLELPVGLRRGLYFVLREGLQRDEYLREAVLPSMKLFARRMAERQVAEVEVHCIVP